MKNIFNYAIWAALLAILIKLAVFEFFPKDDQWDLVPRFAYLFFIPIVLFLSLNTVAKTKRGLVFLDHLKEGMKGGGFFVVLISGFTFVYYKWIHPDYFMMQMSKRLDMAYDQGYSPEDLATLKADLTSSIMTAGMWTSITLLIFTIFAFLCGAVLTLFIRKMGTV